ncbi:MAG TPA: YbhB/YbcL family Raf kinase inhibitor-like protein [Pseudomonadales bacterium]|nr:YbhB/YbcL family Raf kinase inhibitor-like protein [Pseudomonadales bacterium]
MAQLKLKMTSPAFESDAVLPPSMTCVGAGESPPLEWINPPPDARSFALIVDDPDAPGGTFTHWILFDIPGHSLRLPSSADGVGVNGRNDFQGTNYGAPCPPPNHGEHRYYFRLFALDVDSLGLGEGATRDEVEAAMEGHVIARDELMGRFGRKTY